MSSSTAELIKERLNIEDVIGSYIKLEKAGNSLKAKCPFHNEKTPSFFVSKDRGSYYCFGCGEKGDIFTFVEKFESVDFLGALKILADRAGVVIERFAPQTTDKKERLFNLMESATKFFENNLAKEEIPLEYLKKRGLKDSTIKDWRIGYVRDDWREAYDYLKGKDFTESEMERAGMIKTENGKTYDRFRGRIMFPIFDSAGRVVAFSGRILHDDGKSAKYLNSPQTELFDKSKILYGYDRAKQSIRKFDFSILVEGQFDIIMCHQAGFTNTVASSGTALTKDHLALLKRISNKIIMSFDSDNAGAKASERAWALALSLGMEVKVAEVTKGFDPADLILKDKEMFKNVLKNSIHLIDFLLHKITAEITDKKKLWSEIKKRILPYVYLLESSTEKARYVSKISEIISIKEDFIWDDLKKVKLDEEFKNELETGNKTIERQIENQILKRGGTERVLAGMIAKEESDKNKIIDTEVLRGKIKDILGKESYEEFDKELSELINELSFETESYYGKDFESKKGSEKIEKEIQYLLANLQEEKFKKELASLLTDLKKAEQSKDTAMATSILKRANEITKKLSDMKKEKQHYKSKVESN